MSPKPEIYTPKRDDDYLHPFHVRSPPGFRNKEELSLYEFTLWGRDLVSVVRIRESPYYGGFLKKIDENFVGTLETVRNRQVSVPRGSTVDN